MIKKKEEHQVETNTVGTILITNEEIKARAKEIGEEITRDYAGESVILIGILRGAAPWMTDVMMNTNLDMKIDFMSCSSYGASTKSSGIVKINKDLDLTIEDQNVIIIEDIVDSGITLNYLKTYLGNRKPKSLKVCTLLNKPTGRRCDLDPDYVGFEVEDLFIIGYGLDYDQKYRNLPYISYLND